jgi:hypothetical protein
MNVAGSDQGHSRGLGLASPLYQPASVAWAAMQLGHGIGSVTKNFAPTRQLIWEAARREWDAGQEVIGVLGDVVEAKAALALFCMHSASRQEPAKPAVTSPIHRP